LQKVCRLQKTAVSLRQEIKQFTNSKKNSNMKTLKELQNELAQLQAALSKKLVTPTEYSNFYYNISQQIKRLQQ